MASNMVPCFHQSMSPLGNGFFVHPSQVGGGGGSRTPALSASRLTEALRLWSRWFSLWGFRFRGGAGPARPRGNALVSPWHVPGRPSGLSPTPRSSWYAGACVRPYNAGAGTAPLRENHLSRHFGAFHRKAISPRVGLAAEGRAPHARMGTPWLHPGISPLGHRPPDYSSLVMPYPRLASGPATRARGPRPSEKITFRVISGLSPQGHLTRANPPEGRAPHARNDGITPTPTSPPPGHRLIVNPSAANGMPRRLWGLATRTHRVRPSEKTTCALSPGFPR